MDCTDCKVKLERIRVVDATAVGLGTMGAKHIDLHYAPVDKKESWFSGAIDGALPIRGMICPQCRRISLFG